jgi:polysaccharide biosynthesis protein PslG
MRGTALAVASLGSWPSLAGSFAGAEDVPSGSLPGQLKVLGRLMTRSALEIPSSRFSIGFECLDRGMFDPEKVYPHLAKLGVKWARVQTGWARCEKEKGRYDFAWLDRIVDSLRAIGVQPWFNVGYGNRLYTPAAPHETAIGWSPIFTAEARDGWARFVKVLAEHYRERVTRYEVWNEPDYAAFWTPGKPSPEQYVQLVAITAKAIRESIPNATILGGSVAWTAKLNFLEGCFAAGMAEHINALTYHLYPPTPEPFYEKNLPALRAMLKRVAPNLEAWQGESGAPSLGQPGQALGKYEWNEHRQAKWAARRTLLDLAFDVPFIAYFHASDFMFYIVKDQIVNKRYYFGLVGGDNYAPKPAFYAYQSLCTLFAGKVARAADCQPQFSGPVQTGAATPAPPRGYAFETERGRMFAYWQPHDLMQTFTPCATTLEMQGRNGLDLRNPVLLDPIAQKIYSVEKPESLPGGRCRFARLPLTDWPLIVADRGVLPVSEGA